MRVGLLLLIIATVTLLVMQNSTPALPLVLFGSSTIALPVGLWLLMSIGAGLITSLLIQGLTFRPVASSPQVAPRYRSRNPETTARRPPKPDWEQPTNADWDDPTEANEGWDIETPPEHPTTPQTRTVRTRQTRTPERPSPADGVVDADYRVIEPPRTQPNEPNSRDESWDF
ncbi:MAG: hypothetical protein AAGG51_25280 [Cyanobacteria bacterium P01_G01_bin.54]